MVELDTSGIDAFLLQLDALQKSFNFQVNAKYRQWVDVIFTDIVELTPQWSGNLAANWYVGKDAMSASESTIAAKESMWPLDLYSVPYERGDPDAVSISLARMETQEFVWADQVYIYNPTSIAPQVEAESIYIRPENKVDGRVHMIAHAEYFYASYQPLGL